MTAAPARAGPRCWASSPTSTAISPGCSAPGSPATAAAKRLCPIRAAPWAICSAMRCASASRSDIMAAGEGIETVLSLLSLFPALPMAAGLSAAHLRRHPVSSRPSPALPPSRKRCGRRFCGKPARRTMQRGRHRLPCPDSARQGPQRRSAKRSAHAVKARIVAQLAPEDRSRFRP